MLLDSPVPFSEAIKHLLAKEALPTTFDSASLKYLSAAMRRQSLFSAETVMTHYLESIRSVVESVINPTTTVMRDRETEANPQGYTTVGYSPATARATLRRELGALGYEPNAGEEGSIKDLSSDARLNLVVKTNVQLAQGAGKFVQSNADEDVVDQWPAWELVRYEDREKPRNWEQRWKIAAEVSGDAKALACMVNNGRMCALKSSGIWEQLGEGAGGYTDTLDNPYPPFAFNSGMWTEDVARAEAVELGLIGEDEEAQPAKCDFATLFAAPEEAAA